MGFVKDGLEELDNGATQLAVAAGRTYLMAVALKQILAAAGKPSWWAEQVPNGLSDHRALTKWKEDPKNISKLCKAMGVLLKEKVDRDDDYGENANTAANIFQKKQKAKDKEEEEESSDDDKKTGPKDRNSRSKGRKRSKSRDASISSNASSHDGKRKKASKRNDKKAAEGEPGKKDKSRKRKKRSKSSSSGSPMPEKELAKEKRKEGKEDKGSSKRRGMAHVATLK